MSGDNVNPRELFVFRAKLAGIAEHFDDMVTCIREAAKHMTDGGPTVEECELLFTAFHRSVTERRAALRVIHGVEMKTPNSQSMINQEYGKVVVSELLALCSDALHLASSVVKLTSDPDMKVLLTKMIGDHHRYKCEVNAGEASLKAAEEAYAAAAALADEHLTSAHPLRLQVKHAQLVLLMDHAQQMEKARDLAAQIVSCKDVVVNSQVEPAYRDASLTMQLVEDRYNELEHKL